MAPSILGPVLAPESGLERVRHQLLTALHVGRLNPGDRVPSVRRLADLTGLNRKTVHRAYRRLAREGLLDLKPGSGTFVSQLAPADAEAAPVHELLRAANRARASAGELGLPPEVFASFLQLYFGPGLRGLPVVVAECNAEQLGLIEQELRSTLGLVTRPVLLSDLAARARAVIPGQAAVITTDCHRAEVQSHLRGFEVPVHRLALDPAFPLRLLEHAAEAPVVLVVRDRRFAAVFLRLLKQISPAPNLLPRFHVVEPAELRATLVEIPESPWVVLSPLVSEAEIVLPRRARRLRLRWRIEPGSFDRLRASLALRLAASRHEAELPAVLGVRERR